MASKGIYARKDSAWHSVKSLYVNVNGTWFKAYEGWNSATGGTFIDVDDYNGTGQRWRVHSFISSGTLEITTATKPFRLLVNGGGGGGHNWRDPWSGNSGDGGYGTEIQTSLDVGTYEVTVGAGGSANHAGSASSFGDVLTQSGGAAGPAAYDNGKEMVQARSGATRGPKSDITGTSRQYGQGGRYPSDQAPHGPGFGGGYGKGDHQGGAGGHGFTGIVIVAYQIG